MNHQSVLVAEVIQALDLPQRQTIIDATLGLGGHSEQILQQPSFPGQIIGIDQDAQMLEEARRRLEPFGDRFRSFKMNFGELQSLIEQEQIRFDAILFDLGVASPHYDLPERGFSFQHPGPLDMRLDQSSALSAAEFINTADKDELIRVLRRYGEERFAPAIVRAIMQRREEQAFARTDELADLIKDVYHRRGLHPKRHPATKTFQALRIAINRELTVLEQALQTAIDMIDVGGRILVISYHSLEDRIVKQQFKLASRSCICPAQAPICTCEKKPQLRILTKKPIVPSDEEIERNPRARSAKMRVAEKI